MPTGKSQDGTRGSHKSPNAARQAKAGSPRPDRRPHGPRRHRRTAEHTPARRRPRATARRVALIAAAALIAVSASLFGLGGDNPPKAVNTAPAAVTGPENLSDRRAQERAARHRRRNALRTGQVPPPSGTVRPKPSPSKSKAKASPKPKPKPAPAWVKPARRYRVTSGFGHRWGTMHEGVDLAGPTGTPIFAARSGRVRQAGWYGGYGYAVIIRHGNGVDTLYGHNSSLLVREGQRVRTGQRIARMGSTGHSTGPHLHFEVHLGDNPVDPVPWMRKRGVRI